MKIHFKLFLVLLSCIVIFVTASCVQVIHLTQKQTEAEKLDMSYGILKQTMLSYEYVSDMIERYIFDQCRAEGIAGTNQQMSNPSLLKMQMESKIRVIGSNPFLKKGAILDRQGRFFSDAEGAQAQQLKEMAQTVCANAGRDVLWFTDSEGRLYLKRSIYDVWRNQKVADILYEIDRAYLRTSVGLDWFKNGNACLLDEYGRMILTTAETQEDAPLFLALIEEVRSNQTLPRVFHFQGTEYRIIAVSSANGSWSMLYQVRVNELLSSFYKLRTVIILFAFVLVVLAAFVSYLISFSFTSNIRRLKKHIDNVHYDSNISLIPSLGHDEIGDLAKHFNVLLERLDQIYQAMFKAAQEKQHMRYELLLFQYRSLQAQISPHFLCNILSSISVLAMSNKPEQVERLAVDSSRYLRENLRNNTRYDNTIAGEIKLVQDYLKLMNILSATPIELCVHYSHELDPVRIPNMLLQPLVENAVKHGIPPQFQKTFVIDLTVCKTKNEQLELLIEDNGVGFAAPVMEEIQKLMQDREMQPTCIGYGLTGIVRRLALQYQEAFRFEVGSSSKGGASIRMVLPLRRDEHMPHWFREG